MTDRAEQRRHLIDEYGERAVTAIEEYVLDAATPRPGLVEALARVRQAAEHSWSCAHNSNHGPCPIGTPCTCGLLDAFAALASGTGEPGLDGWQPDPDYLCPNCVTPWKCNGPHIPETPPLANDKGADPTPEPDAG